MHTLKWHPHDGTLGRTPKNSRDQCEKQSGRGEDVLVDLVLVAFLVAFGDLDLYIGMGKLFSTNYPAILAVFDSSAV